MRLDDKVDLSAALETLVAGMPEPKIHLDLPLEIALTGEHRVGIENLLKPSADRPYGFSYHGLVTGNGATLE